MQANTHINHHIELPTIHLFYSMQTSLTNMIFMNTLNSIINVIVYQFTDYSRYFMHLFPSSYCDNSKTGKYPLWQYLLV